MQAPCDESIAAIPMEFRQSWLHSSAALRAFFASRPPLNVPESRIFLFTSYLYPLIAKDGTGGGAVVILLLAFRRRSTPSVHPPHYRNRIRLEIYSDIQWSIGVQRCSKTAGFLISLEGLASFILIKN